MTQPVMSADGNYMWTGSEWIPAPPPHSVDSKQSISMQDSVISGDIVHNTVHNDAEAISSAVIAALDQIGLVKGTPPKAITAEQNHQIEEVNKMVNFAEEGGIDLSPDAYWRLFESEIKQPDLAFKHLEAMERSAKALGDVINERKAKNLITFLSWIDDNESVHLPTLESYTLNTIQLAKQHGSRSLEGLALQILSEIYGYSDVNKCLKCEKQMLVIWNELGEWNKSLEALGAMMGSYSSLGQYSEAEACFQSALQIIHQHKLESFQELWLYECKIELVKHTRKGWLGKVSKEGKAEIQEYVDRIRLLCLERNFDFDEWFGELE